jgi:hypothetical protein
MSIGVLLLKVIFFIPLVILGLAGIVICGALFLISCLFTNSDSEFSLFMGLLIIMIFYGIYDNYFPPRPKKDPLRPHPPSAKEILG